MTIVLQHDVIVVGFYLTKLEVPHEHICMPAVVVVPETCFQVVCPSIPLFYTAITQEPSHGF